MKTETIEKDNQKVRERTDLSGLDSLDREDGKGLNLPKTGFRTVSITLPSTVRVHEVSVLGVSGTYVLYSIKMLHGLT